MNPFVVNRHGRLVFPSNFFPDLDFTVFENLNQFMSVIRRDFEAKAPTGTDICRSCGVRQLSRPFRPVARHGPAPHMGQ